MINILPLYTMTLPPLPMVEAGPRSPPPLWGLLLVARRVVGLLPERRFG